MGSLLFKMLEDERIYLLLLTLCNAPSQMSEGFYNKLSSDKYYQSTTGTFYKASVYTQFL